MKKKTDKKEKITDHITYRIIDNTIYLFQDNTLLEDDEINLLYKKLPFVIEDNDITYINISGKNLEERKDFYDELGFTLSYYDVGKLNSLYKGYKDKKSYRCYGIMTKKDFLNVINNVKKDNKESEKKEISNDGFISNILLLLLGVSMLGFLSVQGAIYLVK